MNKNLRIVLLDQNYILFKFEVRIILNLIHRIVTQLINLKSLTAARQSH